MARSGRYSVPFRRRRQGKTNYHLRRRLVISKRTRLVVRLSNSHCIVQFIDAELKGDKTLVAAHSSELNKYNWNYSTSNLPAAYLIGYLCGLKAKKKGIKSAILDIGNIAPIYGSRVFACLKGVIDAGIDIPASEKIFPEEDRLKGEHIANYAKILKEENKELYEKQFSGYKKKKLDPLKIPQAFSKTQQTIMEAFK